MVLSPGWVGDTAGIVLVPRQLGPFILRQAERMEFRRKWLVSITLTWQWVFILGSALAADCTSDLSKPLDAANRVTRAEVGPGRSHGGARQERQDVRQYTAAGRWLLARSMSAARCFGAQRQGAMRCALLWL